MGLKSCQIIFDNSWSTYYGGQTVSGRVELTVDSPKKIRGISICFKGECNTSWLIEETHTDNEGKQERENIEIIGHEEYFKIKYYLVGGQGGGEIELPVGNHVYPFTCVLPPTLPSSFEGEFGHVRYTVKVTLDRPWKFDQETKAAFTVLSQVDLNLNPRLREPVKVSMEKYFCCCWCKSGPLTCIVTLPHSGYVPGQSIPVVAELDNISNVEVLNIHFALKKIVTYHSQTPRRESKKDEVLIAELQVGPVPAHGSHTWNNPISIPPLPPSNLTNCSLIDLDYELLVEVRVAGFHRNLEGKIPITIGTVPFTAPTSAPSAPSADVAINVNPPAGGGDQQGTTQNQMGWVNNLYPTVPPVFEQSQFGTKSIQDKNDNEYTRYNNDAQNYSPMYPVYNSSNNAQ